MREGINRCRCGKEQRRMVDEDEASLNAANPAAQNHNT